MSKLKLKKKIKLLDPERLEDYELNNKYLNLININYKQNKAFEKISKKSNKFIVDSFDIAFKIIKKFKILKFINGPISKKYFLGKKYLGITEYLAKKTNKKKIYNVNFQQKAFGMSYYNTFTYKSDFKKINKILNQRKNNSY